MSLECSVKAEDNSLLSLNISHYIQIILPHSFLSFCLSAYVCSVVHRVSAVRQIDRQKNVVRFSVTAEAVEKKSSDEEQRQTAFARSQGKMEIYGDERGTRGKHARVRLSLFRSCLRASPRTGGRNGRGR